MDLVIFIVALVSCAATPAFAQSAPESYSGRPVSAVRVAIDGAPTTEAALIDLIETRPGQNLTLAAVRESIAHLYSLARFQDVQVEAIDGPGGAIELRYNLVAIRAVDKVEFRGNLALSEGLLRNTVAERFGRTPQPGRAQEVTRELEPKRIGDITERADRLLYATVVQVERLLAGCRLPLAPVANVDRSSGHDPALDLGGVRLQAELDGGLFEAAVCDQVLTQA